MESVEIDQLLDIVKEVIRTSNIAEKSTQSILPKKIEPLPQWASSLTEGTLPLSRTVERLTQNILPYLNGSSLSPAYYGFVTGGVTPAAFIGDVLATIYDQNVSVHLPKETITTNVEVVALNMLVDLFQLPKEWRIGTDGSSGGTFTTGATASNILGLALGREFVLGEAAKRAGKAMSVGEDGILAVSHAAGVDHVKILSTLPHSSIAKAAGIVGIGRANVIDISTKANPMVIDVERLQALAEDAENERTAYIMTLSTGEVNTGHFASDSAEMMQKVREICDRYGIWLHVDGAFGLFGRVLLNHTNVRDYESVVNGVKGVELADSITCDGHKLLNVPYDCGIFFTRHKQLSEQTCLNGNAAYLATAASNIQSPLNVGIENSRRFRALPVYATLSAYGREGYSDMLIRQTGLSRRIAAWLFDHDSYEILPIGDDRETFLNKIFIIVLFKAKDDGLNENLVQKIKDSGTDNQRHG